MLKDNKTIFAIATPPGKSGVAVIRVSGKEAFKSLLCLTKGDLPKPRYASLRTLYNPENGDIIDNAIIITFPAPNSFTGENIVELHIHGSRAISNILIRLLSNFSNFRLALPGEFAKRAFFNNKLDLTEAEGLADLIEAETAVQHKQAMRQMQGALHKLYHIWKDEIIKMLALLEAYIDFPEEDIPDSVLLEIENSVDYLKKGINQHLNDNHRGEIIRRGIYVSIIGAPNVGKSSLLNYLAKREIAIVSNIAGTTRDVIEVNLDLNGYPVTIADTAGLRESLDVIEQEGVKRAINKAQNADLKLLILAADQPLSEQHQVLKYNDENSILIINKLDLSKLELDNAISISIKEKIGIEELLSKLESKIANLYSPSSDPVITRERHRESLKKTLECLNSFDINHPLELACEDLRMAARFLGQITGKIEVETILDQIFSKFCIGK